jgi:hypothetical protein
VLALGCLLLVSAAAEAPDRPPDVTLVVSAQGGGVSAHLTAMLAPDVLLAEPALVRVTRVGFLAYERRGCVLFADDQVELPALRARLEDPTRRRASVSPGVVAQSILDLTVDDAGGALVRAVMSRASGHLFQEVPVRRVRWDTGSGSLWGLEPAGCAEADASSRDAAGWEVRSVTEMRGVLAGGQEVRGWAVARPLGEGTRRHKSLLALREEAGRQGTPLVEVLGGEDIEGGSYLVGTTNLQRPVTEHALRARRPAAWVAQAPEIHDGVEPFRVTARAVGAAPVSANLVDQGGKPLYAPFARVPAGAWDVVVIGVTAPLEAGAVPAGVSRGVRVVPPRPAVEKALAAAVAERGGRWPDLVVVAGALDAAGAAEVEEVRGVDATFVRVAKSYQEVESLHEVSLGGRAHRPAAFSARVSPWRLERTEVWLQPRGGPTRFRHHARPVTLDMVRDDEISRRVQEVRQPIYEKGSRTAVGDVAPLLRGPAARAAVRAAAAPEERDLGRLGRGLWGQMTASILQDATGADVAITPPAREMWKAPGGYSDLRLQAALQGQDDVVLALVPGAELDPLVGRARGARLGVTGMAGSLVGGRAVDPKERYLVATTESVSVMLGLEPRVVATRFLDAGPRYVGTPVGGVPVSYRSVVLERLRSLEQRHRAGGGFGEAYTRALSSLLVARGRDVTPRLVLEARDVTASVSANEVRGREAYPAVPDSRVRTASNLALLVTGMARAALETRWLVLELRGTARWDRRVFQGSDVKEALNSWTTTLEAREPALGIFIPRIKLRSEAFASASYESQFGPLPTATRAPTLPPLAVGRLNAGAAFFAPQVLRELRLGLVAQQDLKREPLYDPARRWRAPGLSVGVECAGTVGYELGRVGVETTGGFRWLAPRPDADTPRDLALTANLRAALKGRVMDGVSVSGFMDAYLFQGKQASDRPGLSLILGIGIAADRRWKPLTELGYFW